MIQDLGQGCLLGKSDVKSAFRLLPVQVQSFDQLGFMFDGKYYVDKAMPFGLFNCLPDLGALCYFFRIFCCTAITIWALYLHYLDDFLFGGPKGTNHCSCIMSIFTNKMQSLGVPVAAEKDRRPYN